MSITLFFPGLVEDAFRDTLFFKKAKASKVTSPRPKGILSELLQQPEHQFSYFSCLFRSFDSLAGKLESPEHYLVLSPCHLAADLKTLHLQAISPLEPAEIEELQSAVSEFLRADAMTIDAVGENHWLLRWPEPIDYQQNSIMELGLGPLSSDEASGIDKGKVNRLQSELQMLLHQHPVNQRRAANGKNAINAFWLWRDPISPASKSTSFDLIAGDELLRGLTAREHSSNQSAPEGNAASNGNTALTDLLQAPQQFEEVLKNSKNTLIGSHDLLSLSNPEWLEHVPKCLDEFASTLFNRLGQTITLVTHENQYCLRPWYQRWPLWKK